MRKLVTLITFVAILSAMMPAFAAVPQWVRDTGIYVKDSTFNVEGYAVTYDLSAHILYRDNAVNDWGGHLTDENSVDEDGYGCTTLLFAENDKVYVWGLVNYTTPTLYENWRVSLPGGWVPGKLSDNGTRLILEPLTQIYHYSIVGGHSYTDSYSFVTQVKVHPGESKPKNRYEWLSKDPIIFRFTEDHELVYERPETVQDDETCSITYIYRYTESNELYTPPYCGNEEVYMIYDDPSLTFQKPQMIPKKDLEWEEAEMETYNSETTKVRYAYDGDIFYLLIEGNIIRGRVEGDGIIFKGYQQTAPGTKLCPIVSQYGLNKFPCTLSFENWKHDRIPVDSEVMFKYDAGNKWRGPSLRLEHTDYHNMCIRNAYTGARIKEFSDPQINDFKNFPSAVTDIDNDIEIRISDNVLRLDVPTRIQIYSTDGSKVIDFTDTEYDFNSLPHGIYIVRAAGKTLKIRI